MPARSAELGDVFWVYRNVTRSPSAFGDKRSRPCCCVDPEGLDPDVWTAVPRLTTGIWKSDLRSPPSPSIGLEREGAWSVRFIHQVLKAKTGQDACRYLGALSQTERDCVVSHYERRLA